MFNKLQYVLHLHMAKRAGKHYDFRIHYPNKKALASFAIPKAKFPKMGEKLLAIKTPDHPVKWLTWTDPIIQGYGTGTFKILQSGYADVIGWGPRFITFELKGKYADGRFVLIKPAKGKNSNWFITQVKKKR